MNSFRMEMRLFLSNRNQKLVMNEAYRYQTLTSCSIKSKTFSLMSWFVSPTRYVKSLHKNNIYIDSSRAEKKLYLQVY